MGLLLQNKIQESILPLTSPRDEVIFHQRKARNRPAEVLGKCIGLDSSFCALRKQVGPSDLHVRIKSDAAVMRHRL